MMQRLRNTVLYITLGLLIGWGAQSLYATTITWSKTFADGQVLSGSDLETMKTNITDVVNAGGGPVGLTNSQTITGDKTISGAFTASGTNTLSGATTVSGALTASSTITLSGNILGASPLILEGATADAYETTISVTDPTADRAYTFANADFTTLGIGDAGDTVQVVYTETGALATGSIAIPQDDTIPQNTEGVEYMTQVITPTNSSNILEITVIGHFTANAAVDLFGALFQDATAGALAASTGSYVQTNESGVIVLRHYMTAGTTSATTFKFRAGADTGDTVTFNGIAAARLFGGVAASSICIKEIRA